MRTGDTPADERRQLRAPPARHPHHHARVALPHAHVAGARDAARRRGGDHRRDPRAGRHQAGRPPGAHPRAARQRIARARPPQRIGLSATQRPLDEIARFLGGSTAGGAAPGHDRRRRRAQAARDRGRSCPSRTWASWARSSTSRVSGPAAGAARRAAASGRRSTRGCSSWSSEHRSTLIFVNARRLAERLATASTSCRRAGRPCREASGRPPAERAGEGAPRLARRASSGCIIEDELKSGRLKGLVATSVARARHRHGRGRPRRSRSSRRARSPRACSASAAPATRSASRAAGKIFPKHRGDLVEAAVVVAAHARRPDRGRRATRATRSTCSRSRSSPCARSTSGRSTSSPRSCGAPPTSPSSPTTCSPPCSTCSPGRYPSDEFAELRPRIVWDRVDGTVRGARAARSALAVTSGGTIPDRGLFGVFLPDGTRVGELDEEMVYESRPGETFLLGASTWRIEDITYDRVIVTPAPGRARQDAVLARRRPGPAARARPGASARSCASCRADAATRRRRGCAPTYGLDELGGRRTSSRTSTSRRRRPASVPDDRTIVVERFRDEIGDWRICVLSPVRRPGARAVGDGASRPRLRERLGIDVAGAVERRRHRAAPARGRSTTSRSTSC